MSRVYPALDILFTKRFTLPGVVTPAHPARSGHSSFGYLFHLSMNCICFWGMAIFSLYYRPFFTNRGEPMLTMVVSGRLGRDVEFRYTPQGEPMAAYTIAVSTGADKPPLWIDVVQFGKAAETFAKLEPHKGDFVLVRVCRPFTVKTWQDKTGATAAGVSVVSDWTEIVHRAIPGAGGDAVPMSKRVR
jgi:Single-strand binding protein family